MRIIPVMDLQNGQVVRGIAGRRSEYRPIVSKLTASSVPLDVALAFRKHYGLSELYLADLDAIAGEPPAYRTYAELMAQGFSLWVDAGVRSLAEAVALADARIANIVVGLETVEGPYELARIVQQLGPERTVFSLDLRDGQPLGNVTQWGEPPDPLMMAAVAIADGLRRLIVLDLGRVGTARGVGTEELCCRLATVYGEGVEVIAGGGVRDQADIDRLAAGGIAGVLVASAFHDGRLKLTGPP